MTPHVFLHQNYCSKKSNVLFTMGLVLLFDLDGTLFDTNFANNAAYKAALWQITRKSDYEQLNNLQRITRKDIADLPGITSQTLESIVQRKETLYEPKYTFPFITYEILKLNNMRFHIPCYIISTADPKRVQQLVMYYKLDHFIEGCIFANTPNKYQDIVSKLGAYGSDTKILFENDKNAIANAVSNGININDII